MNLEGVRQICRSLAGVTEDIKWGADLAFSVGGRMFAVVCVDPPHQISFKCSPEAFGELVERPGLIPAPYLARAQWVQEQALGEALDRAELQRLLHASYELVRAKLPKSTREALGAGATRSRATRRRTTRRQGRVGKPRARH